VLRETQACHFNLFSASYVAEDELLNVLTTNTVTGIPRRDMCTHFAAGGQATLLNDPDLEG
jgi:hypothetical protein